MFAHSLRLVLPNITAPASRSLCATVESSVGLDPTNAKDPAVVCILSAVSMLSLISTGIPCNGPRGPLALDSISREAAMARASGLISIMLFTRPLSSSSIRAKYAFVRADAERLPDFIFSCNSPTVTSSNMKGFACGGVLAATASTRPALSAGTVPAAQAAALSSPRRETPEELDDPICEDLRNKVASRVRQHGII